MLVIRQIGPALAAVLFLLNINFAETETKYMDLTWVSKGREQMSSGRLMSDYDLHADKGLGLRLCKPSRQIIIRNKDGMTA